MINDQHNHSSILVDFHSVQRKITMTSEIKNDISRQLKVQTTSSQIIFNLRISNLISDSSIDSKNSEIINSLIKSRDIYNLKTKFRRDSLKSLTSVQALIRKLNREN